MGAADERAMGDAPTCPPWSLGLVIVGTAGAFVVAAGLLGSSPIYHDNGAIAYPLRVLISTALRHGIFPMWDHWTHGGAPLCTFLTALPLSPIVLTLGAFGIYDQTTFVVELVVLDVLALVGMFCWLRTLVDEATAVMGGVAFALSAILVSQAPINIEAIASQAMIPWYALGLRQCLRGLRRGAAVIAAALWVMFTTGYPGLNLFVLEIVTVYVVADHVFVRDSGASGTAWRGIAYATIGGLLFVGIVNFALLETVRNIGLDVTQVRQTRFNPFTGSTHPAALYTLLWPNDLSPFEEYQGGAHVFPLYAGSATLLGVIASVAIPRRRWARDGRRVAILLAAASIAFVATTAKSYGGELFVHILPFYDKVRFHCWGLTVVVFLVTTLGALGLQELRARGGASATQLRAFVLAAVALLVLQRNVVDLAPIVAYPQWYTVPIVALLLSRRGPARWNLRMSLLVVASLFEMATVSRQIPSLRDGSSGMAALTRERAGALAHNETVKTAGFSPPPNQRTGHVPENAQYFTKVPAYAGYNTNIHATIRRLQDDPRFADLMSQIFYAIRTDGSVVDDGLTDVRLEMTPNLVDAWFVAPSTPTLVTYAAPFTPGWRLQVDGAPTETTANVFGLTSFRVAAGAHHVSLRYRPPGLLASSMLSIASLGAAIVLAMGR
jgi:hypothetical protein